MKFWKCTLLCSLGLLGLFLAIAFCILVVSTEDKESYRQLMEVSNSTTALKSDSSYTAEQLKEGTKKTLLIKHGEERKIAKLSCDSSVLCFAKENQKGELHEEMHGLNLVYQEELSSLIADHALYFYGQERLKLSGNILWEHPIGSLKAKSAEATFDIEAKVPQEITMQEGLDITLKDGATVHAPYAWVGTKECVAILHGDEGEKVTYAKSGCEMKSLKAKIYFNKPKMSVERILADDLVEIAIKPDLHLTGKHAIFEQFSPQGVFGKGTLSCEHGSSCVMKQGENEIRATKGELNSHAQTVVLDHPQGVLKAEGIPLYFKARQMTLDKSKERLELDPPVHMEWLGVLDTSGTVEISQKNQSYGVFIQGQTDLDWEEHHLTVNGTLTIDPVLKIVRMTSNESSQAHFWDTYGEIFADQATLFYDDKQKPLKLVLEGNIRLQNTTAGALQYALADEGSFDWGKNILTLKAKDRPRVLFYDELNKVQASAPGLTINRDPKNGQNVLKGLGNVRFIFAEEELNELKKRFSFEPK